MTYRIGIIGGGHMGAAVLRGVVDAGICPPREIVVAEVNAEKCKQLAQHGCTVVAAAVEAADAEVILLAVKPQVFADVARSMPALPVSRVVISIMAGLASGTIRRSLGGKARIVRAMPNVACQIRAGMTAIALGEGAKRGDEVLAKSIFDSLGRTVMVDESLMHAVTAVSGSGPAYVFLLAEAMEHAAQALGFDQATARLLVTQTVLGAGKLLSESDSGAAALRASVTSPGGTTAAAMEVFKSRSFTEIVVDALTAARDRGISLDSE